MKFVLSFRGQAGRRLTAEEEAQWPAWFEQIRDCIADFGNRVGQVREVGGPVERSDALSGYIIVNADNLHAAATLAERCPILQQGGSVEVGELVDA
jgi:antibiotic biosynthesis monooxygenase (ABM) superfamily enzyme